MKIALDARAYEYIGTFHVDSLRILREMKARYADPTWTSAGTELIDGRPFEKLVHPCGATKWRRVACDA